MTTLLRRLFIAVFLLLVTGGFLFYLFPSKKAADYIAARIHRGNSEITLDIEAIKPALWTSLSAKNVQVFYQNNLVGILDRITADPAWKAMLRGKREIDLSGDAAEGKFSGSLELPAKGKKKIPRINVYFDGIGLAKIPAIETFTGMGISGILSGTASRRLPDDQNQGGKKQGNADLKITDSRIPLPITLPGIDAVEFTEITAKAEMKGNRLQIESIQASGPQINGSMTGVVMLKKPYKQSRLNLRGILKPRPAFQAVLNKNVPPGLLPRPKPGSDGISFSISGTIHRPNPRFL